MELQDLLETACGEVAVSRPDGPVIDRTGEPATDAPTVQAAPSPGNTAGPLEIDRYLSQLVQLGGSDLHLCAGEAPMIRLHGDMQRLDGAAALTPEETHQMLEVLMPDRNRTEFEEETKASVYLPDSP